MKEFKVGDKVQIVSSPYVHTSLQPGRTGRIVGKTMGAEGIFDVVLDDSHPDSTGDLDWPFDAHELEVIQ